MLIAALVVATGLLVGAWAATTWRLRLSGVVVVALLSVYTLINVATLPVFLLSAVLAYLAIHVVQDRWLLYGRRLLLTAIVLGAVLPVAVFLVFDAIAGRPLAVSEVEFLGSILPGIAAYNYFREDVDRRRIDLAASASLFVGLVVLGTIALWQWSTPPCTTCGLLGVAPAAYVTPLVAVAGSDVAVLLGLPTTTATPVLGTVGSITVVLVAGLALTELVRSRWGLRPVGVVAIPLLALFALHSWWTLAVYIAVAAVTTLVVRQLHARTLLYGRALLSVAGIVAVLLMLTITIVLGLPTSVAMFFSGLLAGIGAYNVHVAAPTERADAVVVNAGVFVVVFALARLLIAPFPTGLAAAVTAAHVLAGGLLVVLAAWAIREHETDQPSNDAILEASAFGPEEVAR